MKSLIFILSIAVSPLSPVSTPRKVLAMDDQLLAKQYAKTGNLMDLCHDPAWSQESTRIEDETGGQIELISFQTLFPT
jgi:hypothetical protein